MLALSFFVFRSLASNRGRTALLLAAVMLSMTAFSAVLLTSDAIARGLELAIRTTVGNAHLQVRTTSGYGFADSTLQRVRAVPDVVAVAEVARKRVFYRTSADHGFVELIAVDPDAEPLVRTYRLSDGQFLSADRPNGVVVRASWAAERGLRVGDPIELITQDGLTRFDLVGFLASDEAGIASYGQVVLVSLELGRAQFGMQDRISTLALILGSEDAVPQVRDVLRNTIQEAHVIRSAPDIRAELGRSVSELQAVLLLFGATALFVAVFLIFNTVEMTVVEQLREIGQLRAAGATRRQIFGYFLLQALTPGVVGALAGTLLGFALAHLLAVWIARTQEVAIAPVDFSVPIMVISLTVGLVVIAASALIPALRASRTNAIDLLYAREREASSMGWRLVGLGTALAAVSLLSMVLPVPGPAGRLVRALLLFPFLAGLVFAARAAVIPLCQLFATVFRHYGGHLGGAAARLAARNLLRHVGRTSLTVAGFMVSLSLLVGIAAVASSSIQAGDRWTLSLLPGDLVVVSPVDQPPVFIEQFAEVAGVQYASPVSFFPVRSEEAVVQVAAVDPAVYGPGLEIIEGGKSSALAAIESGGSVLVPRRLAEARGLRLGDVLSLLTTEGPRPFHVAGIVAHSFPSVDGGSTMLMSRADAERWFGQQGFRLLMVEPKGPANAAYVAAQVAQIAERYGMSVTTAQNIAAEVATALARLLALLGALVAIGLLIGAFGTANTMLMNLVERQRELSVLWAAGMSRSQLRAMAVAEAGMMGLMGGILGTLVGGALSWLLVSFSRTPGFEPDYVFPWTAALVGIALAVLGACAAAIVPAHRIAAPAGR